MDNSEVNQAPSLEPPVEEASSDSSNNELPDKLSKQELTKKLSSKLGLKKKKKMSNNLKSQNPSIGQIERMKDYVEERMGPFKNEVAKLHTDIINQFNVDLKKSSILMSLKNIQMLHESIVKKYAQNKADNNTAQAKLDSQLKLNKHLEDTLSSTIRDKDDLYIQLKSDIVVLEKKLEAANNKLRVTNKDESLIEYECRELRERLIDNEKLLDMQISNNKELEATNTSLSHRLESLEKDTFEYKNRTQTMINNKNTELVDLRSRLAVIDQKYTDEINVLLMEKNKLQHTFDVESSEAELLNMKLSVLSNKIKTVIEQKGFLLENVESCIDNLKQEWEKLKDH